ncbi:MAG TPA: GNAT family N-acetyltransferase [Candidatus Aquilonibacter sp.]|nr:GNAT family N-acetyltransferase [Candidatus Aquilonibacter sp.]
MRNVDVTVRSYQLGDAPALIELFERSVRDVGPARYSPAQVSAWLRGARDPQHWHERLAEREAYIAQTPDGTVLGWIEMELDGHLDYLYCAPEATRSGVADVLYAVLIAGARKLGITRLTTEASRFAESFFSRHGWQLDRREVITRDGVEIDRARMSVALG